MKKITIILLSSVIIATSFAQTFAQTFSDVQDNYVYKDAIEYMKTNNIVSGFSDGEFKPDRTITRGEFTKILIGSRYSKDEIDNCITNHYREWGEGEKEYIFATKYNEGVGWISYGSPTVYWPPTLSDIFKDVAGGVLGEIRIDNGLEFFNSGDYPHFNPPFHKYICIAKTKGIIDGYSDGTFRPEQPITVAEASKIIANTYGLTNNPVTSGEHKFKPFIDALANKKAIPETIYSIDGNLLRGEMAEIIHRIKFNTEKNSLTYDILNNYSKGDVYTSSKLKVSVVKPQSSVISDYFFEEKFSENLRLSNQLNYLFEISRYDVGTQSLEEWISKSNFNSVGDGGIGQAYMISKSHFQGRDAYYAVFQRMAQMSMNSYIVKVNNKIYVISYMSPYIKGIHCENPNPFSFMDGSCDDINIVESNNTYFNEDWPVLQSMLKSIKFL